MGPSSTRNPRVCTSYMAIHRETKVADFRPVLSCIVLYGDILRQESNAPQNRPTYLLLCSMTCQRPIWMITTAIPTQFHRMVVSTPSLYGNYQALKFEIQFWDVNFDEVPFEL